MDPLAGGHGRRGIQGASDRRSTKFADFIDFGGSGADGAVDARSPRPRFRSRWAYSAVWVRTYSILLFALCVVYYNVVFLTVIQLFNFVAWLVGQPRETIPGQFLILAGITMTLVLILRLTGELCTSLIGLVTNRFDDISDADGVIPQTRWSAPQLHALISDVARRIGSPVPDVVHITPCAECYVSEKRRFGLRPRRVLTLVLGLPHLSVLSAAELRVIIAHELAHIRGGDTRLGVFLHRFLESLRAANQQQQEQRTAWIDPIYWFRWAYFNLCLMLSAPVFRHQEIHADTVSASVHGGELTARTLLREWLLAQQFESLVENYNARCAAGQPPEDGNIFQQLSRQFQSISPAAQDYLHERFMCEKQYSLFDSHPTMRDRFAAVQAYPPQHIPESHRAGELLPELTRLQLRLHRQLACC